MQFCAIFFVGCLLLCGTSLQAGQPEIPTAITLPLHIESVGTIEISKTDNQLIVRASLTKHDLAAVLKFEDKCAPQDMMARCAPDYLVEHVRIFANGQQLELALNHQAVTRDNIDFIFVAELAGPLEVITVNSDYVTE